MKDYEKVKQAIKTLRESGCAYLLAVESGDDEMGCDVAVVDKDCGVQHLLDVAFDYIVSTAKECGIDAEENRIVINVILDKVIAEVYANHRKENMQNPMQ